METEAQGSSLINPTSSKEREAKRALDAHFEALRTVYRDFPAFPDLMKKLERIIGGYGKDKNISPEEMQFGDVMWQRDGWIVFHIVAGPILVPGAKTMEHVMRVMFKIGRQLVAVAAMKRTTTRLIAFKQVQIDSKGCVKFRIYNGNVPMSPPDVIKIPVTKRAT